VDAFGPLGIARVQCMSADIERTRAHVTGHDHRLFSFLLLQGGGGTFSHYGHDTALEAGDITLCDSSTPHRMSCSDATQILIIRTPPDLLRRFFPFPEQLCGRRLARQATFADVATNMAQSVWRQCERGPSERFATSMARNLLDVLATSYAVSFDDGAADSSVVAARRIHAQRFIEAHLRDQDLTPVRVANALHISPRYLRMLFEGEQESITSYILRRRLEECAKQIANPLWYGHTITQIAFASGFNSAAHFTRAFREHYGTTPTGYRRDHLSPRN
jgi:AraC-like DNA-binding protein